MRSLQKLINRLLRENLLMPLFVVAAFIVVTLTPILWSVYEASFQFGSGPSDVPAAHVYSVDRRSETALEQVFASVNGVKGFAPVDRSLILQFTLDRLADLDLSSRTIFVSGKVSAVWSPESIGKTLITPDRYQEERIADYKELDLLKDLEMPDLIQDDYYSYEPVLFREIQRGDQKAYLAEYNFAGNLRFPLNLREYPLDIQHIPLQVRHKILPSYMLRLQTVEPSLAFEQSEYFVGQYRLDNALPIGASVEALYDPGFQQLLETSPESANSFVKDSGRLEDQLKAKASPNQFGSLPLAHIQSLYFDGPVGPRSISGLQLELRRQFSTTLLRAIFPVSLALLLLALASYMPMRFTDVKLAVPPTILVSLVFMQQGAYSGLPDLGYPIFLDYFYLLAYVVTLLMFGELLLSSLKKSANWSWLLTYKRIARVAVISVATLAPVGIWIAFRLFNLALASR